MKIKLQLLLLAFFAISINSCKKSNNTNGPVTPTVKPKYLTRVIDVGTHPGGGTNTSFIDYTYDDKKRLTGIKISDQAGFNNSLSTYTYNSDDGNLYSIETSSNGIEFGNNVFTFEGGKVKSAISTSYRDNAVFNEIKWDFVYNAKGQVSETHHEVYYETYEYDSNNNLSKVSYFGSTNYASVYQYDDKKNKFINSPFNCQSLDPAGDRYSPNNVVKISSLGLNDNYEYLTTYVYDSDGYPTGGSSGTADNGDKFTYVYSTLE
jgi:hypothetical protein